MKLCKFGIVALAVCLIISQALAAEVVIQPSRKKVTQGQTFNLDVLIDPKGVTIAGAQLNIEFNKSIINVNNVTQGDFFERDGAKTFFSNGTINNSLGRVENIYAVILGPFSVSTPGTFITINATTVGSSGRALINLYNVKISDPGGKRVAVNVSNASVKVGRAAR